MTARRLLGAALTALLVLRAVIAPLAAPAALSGFVALCAAGESAAVPAGPFSPTGEQGARDPCPWLGLGAVAPDPVAPMPSRSLAPVPARTVTAVATQHLPALAHVPQAPRAPPVAA